MKFLADLLGGGLVKTVADAADDLFTSDEERMKARIEMRRIDQKGDLAQIAVNKVEAGHRSLFVAGWRPFFGWASGVGYVLCIVAALTGHWIGIPVEMIEIAVDMTQPIGMTLLGFGGFRTFEKWRGVARERMR